MLVVDSKLVVVVVLIAKM